MTVTAQGSIASRLPTTSFTKLNYIYDGDRLLSFCKKDVRKLEKLYGDLIVIH